MIVNDAIAAQPKTDTYDKWRANDDLRTLTEAQVIKKDPVRMKHVQRAAKEKLSEIEQIKGLASGKAA
jgi:hypothetical protein